MSDKPLAQRLGIEPGMIVYVTDPPEDYLDLIGELPEHVAVTEDAAARAHVVHIFARSLDQAEERLLEVRPVVRTDTLVWVSYPKGRPREEMNRDSLWDLARDIGMDAVAQMSVDETWSAVRLKPRPAVPAERR